LGLTLWRITTHYMCAGVLVDEKGWIKDAAPILRWSIGKNIDFLERWVVESKKGTCKEVK